MLPAIFVGAWGASYWFACLQELQGTGGPVAYRLKTPGGDLSIRASSWSVDARSGELLLNELKLTDPDGVLLASAQMVRGEGLTIEGLRTGSLLRFKGRGVYVRLEREVDGKFQFEKFLKVQEGPPSKLPFSLELERVQVLLVDLAGKERFVDRINSSKVVVEGSAEAWTATGGLRSQIAGPARVVVRTDVAGLSIRGSSTGLNLTRYWQHLQTTPESKDLDWIRGTRLASLTLERPAFDIGLPKDGELSLRVTGLGSAKDLLYETYHVDSATAQVVLTERGVTGDLDLREAGTTANASGAISWKDDVTLALTGTVVSPKGRQGLPKWAVESLPNDIQFGAGTFRGQVTFKGSTNVAGDFELATLAYAKERVTEARGSLIVSPEQVRVELNSAVWRKEAVKGALAYNLKSGALTGGVRSNGVQLSRIAKEAGLQRVQGRADLVALIGGTDKKPTIELFGSGKVEFDPLQDNPIGGNFRLSGFLKGATVELSRFAIEGQQGALTAYGTWNLDTYNLNLKFFGSGVPAEIISKDLRGSALFTGNIRGTTEKPLVNGQLELYDAIIAGQEVPILQSAFTVDRNQVVAEDISSFRGASRITGRLAYAFAGGALNGELSAEDLQLAQLIGDQFAGSISANRASIRGTLSNPIIEATLSGQRILANGIMLDDVRANAVLEGKIARIDNLVVTANNGRLTGSGSLNTETRDGLFSVNVNDFPLFRLNRILGEDLRINGVIDGQATGQISRGAFTQLEAEGEFDQVRINDVPFGGGPWSLNATPTEWRGSGSLGDLNRFIEIADASYKVDEKTVQASINALGVRLQDIVRVARRSIGRNDDDLTSRVELPPAVIEQMDGAAGAVNTSIDLSGDLNDPDLNIRHLSVENLSLAGNPSGVVDLTAKRNRRQWTLDHLTWKGGPGDLSVSGSVQEHGDLSLDGEIRGLDVDWLAQFAPVFGRFQGQSDVSFTASGKTREPDISASYAYRSAIDPETNNARRVVDSVLRVSQGQMAIDGTYNFEGFSGTVEGSIPFRYPFEFPRNEPINGVVRLPRRNLNSLAEYAPGLSATSDGEIAGLVQVTGTLDDPSVVGSAELKAKSIGFNGLQTGLADVLASLDFKGDSVTLQANGASTAGGTFRTESVSLNLGGIDNIISGGIDRFLDSELRGSVMFDRLQWLQRNPEKLPTGFELDTRLDGRVDVSGSVRNLLVSTEQPLQISGTRFVMPNSFAEGSSTISGAFDPKFRIQAQFADRARFLTSTGNFDLTGSANIGGSLLTPAITSELFVERGQLRLPNARITLDDGGTIQAQYQVSQVGETLIRLEVNLRGRTGLTARGFGGNVERYDISLDIRGDLLKEGGLVLTAQSSPPGLSQDEILNLLGQGEILAGRQNQGAVRFDRQLQNALTQIALPALLDTYTSQWASQLGLDYFGFEYNPFENISLTLAKGLGNGFTLQYRRQLQETNGLPPRYDLRLFYRPPFRRDLLGRFSFSVGLDQDRPWKISVEYGFRF
ncbi:MAG TPA: hypothetical protein PKA27_14325 [Fimbriimonadaceae bacterium]|nr:hypothetical protein [Fimbriimonadaceae bacterium]